MRLKLLALWHLLWANHYLLVTPSKTLGVVPKDGERFWLMQTIAKKLDQLDNASAPKQPTSKKGKKGESV